MSFGLHVGGKAGVSEIEWGREGDVRKGVREGQHGQAGSAIASRPCDLDHGYEWARQQLECCVRSIIDSSAVHVGEHAREQSECKEV